MRRAALVFLLSLGCHETEALPLPVPADAAFFAAVVFEGETFVDSSALVPIEEGRLARQLPITVGEQTSTYFVAYTEEQIAATGASLDDFAQGPLRLAGFCEDRLPLPAWTRLATPEGGLTEAELPVSLSHQALLSDCPGGGSLVAGTIDGRSAPCLPASSRSGCVFDIDLRDCELSSKVTGNLMSDGSLCIEPPEGCEPVDRQTVRCNDTTVTVDHCASSFQLDRLEVVNEEVTVPYSSQYRGYLDLRGIYSGWVSDVLLLGDRVLVPRYQGADGTPRLRNVACRPISADHDYIPNMSLSIYDANDLTLVEETPLPPCTVQMIADPNGDGFLAFYRDDPDIAKESPKFAIGRFDASGELIESNRLPDDLDREWRNADYYYNVRSVLLSPDAQLLYAVIDAPDVGPPPEQGFVQMRARVYAIRTDTLEVTSESDLLNGTELLSAVLDGSTLYVLDDAKKGFLELDTRDLSVSRRNEDTFQGYPLLLFEDPERDRVLAFEGGIDPAIAILDGRSVTRRVDVVALGSSAGSAALFWSQRPNLLFAGVLTRGTSSGENDRYDLISQRVARLVEYDLVADRFVPCDEQLGLGPVTRMREDDAGRMWLLLPWEGTVVRVTD